MGVIVLLFTLSARDDLASAAIIRGPVISYPDTSIVDISQPVCDSRIYELNRTRTVRINRWKAFPVRAFGRGKDRVPRPDARFSAQMR